MTSVRDGNIGTVEIVTRRIKSPSTVKEPVFEINADETKRWKVDGVLHREDGPAIEWLVTFVIGRTYQTVSPLGVRHQRWRQRGRLHREGGPAIVYADGTKAWFCHGQRHREDGPAIECPDGTKYWYQHGRYHREGGPAIEHASGTKEWFRHGRRHREDGPAIEWAHGEKQWYLNGEECTRTEWLRGVVGSRLLTPHQREFLDALTENWDGTPELLYATVTNLAE